MSNLKNMGIYELSNTTKKWEPFMVEGTAIGQVSWISQEQNEDKELFAGLWKHSREEHPDGMPYGVKGKEVFYVVKGQAEIETENGVNIEIKEGHSYSFNEGFSGTWKTSDSFVKFFVNVI